MRWKLILLFELICAELYLDMYTYQGIEASACTGLITAKGTLGCSSKSFLVSGALYQISNASDIDNFIASTTGNSWAVVMPSSLLSPSNLEKLTNRISGLLLIRDSAKPPIYSLDEKIPNHSYGLYKTDLNSHVWNPNGLDMLSKPYDIPIFEIFDSEASNPAIRNLLQALGKNLDSGYNSYPLYAMDFRNSMYAEINAHRCLTKKLCDPLGERSVWSTFSSSMKQDDKKPIILVSSRFDATALVRDLGIGASSKASIAVLLAVVEALSKSPTPMSELPKSIIFTFFGGETWGYGGSSRFVQEINKPFNCKQLGSSNDCPFGICSNPCVSDTGFTKINFDNIESIVEFDTVGLLQKSLDSVSNITLYLQIDQVNPKVKDLLQEFSTTVPASTFNSSSPMQINVIPAGDNNRLPPSSAMAFLAKRPDIPTIVISDYKSKYSNPYHNSEFDDGSTWNSQHISLLCSLANTTARSLFKLTSGEAASSQISANCSKLNEYLDCLTRNISCSLMQNYLPNFSFTPISSSYSSVFKFDNKPKPSTYLINRILTDLTAVSRSGVCKVDSDCPDDNVCISNMCVNSLTRYHNAYGTGLEFDYDKGIWKVVDPELGTFVESRYAATQIRVYLITSLWVQLLQLGLGIVVTVATGVLVVYWNKVVGITS